MKANHFWVKAILVVFMSSCTPIQPPELNLADMQFGEVRPFETELQIGVRIENENPQPLTIDGAAYRIYLNDVYIGKGMSSESVSVPALGSAVQQVTVKISNISLLPKVQKLLNTRGFTYRIEGRLYQGVFSSISVSETGTFSMEQQAD
jgi:LEA14-like dessication related protein